VSAKPKRRVPQKKQRTERKDTPSVLARLQCESVRYDFDIPIDSFKAKAFTKETGLKQDDHWAAVLPTDDSRSGYHAHFSGNFDRDRAHIRVEYWDHAVKRRSTHPPPSTESVMAFVGSFIREPSARSYIYGRFEKPDDTWRSRFNLPFKVTMGGSEVVIDGVSVVLPKNRFQAMNGWLTKSDSSLLVSVALVRQVEFATFDLADQLTVLNESIKMFVEPLP
jgi:hypothetical protein